MSNSRREGLFVFTHDSGFLVARVGGGQSTPNLMELISIPTFEIQGSHGVALARFNTGKKAYLEASIVLSHREFRHLVHKPETIQKQKASEYLPGVVKQWVDDDKDDFFFQVLDLENGDLVAIENPMNKPMLITGLKMKALAQVQHSFLERQVYPLRMECSLIVMVGLVRKLIKANRIKGPLLILELFLHSGLLAVVPSEGAPFIRSIDSGEMSMCEQVRKELSLKDERSARKLMHSATIDLSDIARQVVSPVMKEIASVVGLFEVETGQSVAELMVINLMPSHRWVVEMLAKDLGMDLVNLELQTLAELLGVNLGEGVEWDMSDNRILPLMALLGTL